MPKIDFAKVDDAQGFAPVPAGRHLCRLVGVEPASTQHGDEMWKLRWEVLKGPHAGRLIFDNLVFSPAALKRAKLVCSRLGLDVTKEVDLTPDLIKGKAAVLTVEVEAYQDSEGRNKPRNVVPFAGYERADEADAGPVAAPVGSDEGEENLPF